MLTAAKTCAKIIFFRANREDLLGFRAEHLLFGLGLTWLAGIGRYWDHSKAERLQHLGVGSVIYVFFLAALLFFTFRPLFEELTYFRILTFITLTSPPALLYAIPVEQFTALPTAQSINLWFLLIVAAWRVAMLFRFLRVTVGMTWWKVVMLGLLPLCVIVMALAMLNLEHVVINVMAGNPNDNGPNDRAYFVTLLLAVISTAIGPVLFIFWLALVVQKRLEQRKAENR